MGASNLPLTKEDAYNSDAPLGPILPSSIPAKKKRNWIFWFMPSPNLPITGSFDRFSPPSPLVRHELTKCVQIGLRAWPKNHHIQPIHHSPRTIIHDRIPWLLALGQLPLPPLCFSRVAGRKGGHEVMG